MGVIKEWEIKDGKLTYVADWKGHETSVSCLHTVEDGLWSGQSLSSSLPLLLSLPSPSTLSSLPRPAFKLSG